MNYVFSLSFCLQQNNNMEEGVLCHIRKQLNCSKPMNCMKHISRLNDKNIFTKTFQYKIYCSYF